MSEAETLEQENARLRTELEALRAELHEQSRRKHESAAHSGVADSDETPLPAPHPLSKDDICRYSRQLLTPEIGAQGQSKLKASSMLIVGAGGLGAPLMQYLAGAGVGRIGVVDSDVVSLDNLHRQIIHTEANVGIPKVESAARAVKGLNSSVEVVTYNKRFTSEIALELVKKYDIILDATDNVPTRYLINDASMMLGKPLVSGSALRMEGQVTVYGLNGPCYRCIFPKPPPPEAVTNCSDGGVLGVIPGIIGCLQALEAIKIAAGVGTSISQKLLLFDGTTTRFRTIQLRGKNPACLACGTAEKRMKELIDYQEYCNAPLHDQGSNVSVLSSFERVSCETYKEFLDKKESHVLLDVRPHLEYQICHLDNAISMPLAEIPSRIEEIRNLAATSSSKQIFVICRKGNASQIAVRTLQSMGLDGVFKDVVGGVSAWAREVDPAFPTY